MSFPVTTGFGLPTPCPEDKKAWQLAWPTMANPRRKLKQNAPVQSRFRRAEDNAKASAARSSHQWQQPGCPAHDDAYKHASSRWFLAARVDSHVGGCICGSLSLIAPPSTPSGMLPSISSLAIVGLALLSRVSCTILQNGQVRITDFPNTRVDPAAHSFTTYPQNATQISYQGRWDSKYVSWWS